jgi:hypothetical protein
MVVWPNEAPPQNPMIEQIRNAVEDFGGEPTVDNIQAEFDAASTPNSSGRVSIDGKKIESETYKILGILDAAKTLAWVCSANSGSKSGSKSA